MSLKVSNTAEHKSFRGLYDVTAYVQSHTLINRGITTLGGSTVPQCIMSNNKYEAQERAIMGGVYFVASYLTPILLIPFYNKYFLKNKGIIKDVNSIGKRIIQVPKRYLTGDGNILVGLKETAKKFDGKTALKQTEEAFDEIYNSYKNPEKLKKDLLSVHEKILMTDFITTAGMWSMIPWIATETTEKITKRSDFSAGFNLKQDTEKKSKAEQLKSKKNKIIWNILFSVLPGIVFSKMVTKGLSVNSAKLAESKNFVQAGFNKILKKINDNPNCFDYTSGTKMSKTIYAAIWVLSSFPAKIISSRDNNERKDRALRDAGLFTMFFGGDFLINNVAGRCADKFLGTKIMASGGKDLNFFERFKLQMRNFKDSASLKELPPDVAKKTRNIGAGLYWFSLITNTALIGFALPKLLNKFLRYNIKNEKS